MAIYTSFFGNYRNFPEDSYVIGVTRSPPDGVENCADLAPAFELLWQLKNNVIDEFVFKVKYLESLRDKDYWQRYLRDLEKKYKNIILCCYEKKEDFCHRHILAEWLDLDIQEL